MKSRPLIHGATYFVTRRTHQGLFRMVPTPQVNGITLFCLAHAANKYGIQVHAFCFMSNHYHLVVTNHGRQLNKFVHWLDLFTSKCLNCLHGNQGIVWEAEQSSVQLLPTEFDILDKIAYTICNPVQAALVSQPSEWIGTTSLLEHHRSSFEFCARRPDVFFSKTGVVPPEANLSLSVPTCFEDKNQFMVKLGHQIETRCLQISHRLEREGREIRGKESITLDPDQRAAQPFLTSDIRPYIACKDRELRVQLIEAYQIFWQEHEEARQRVLAGEMDVVFPFGTNWWCEYAGRECTETGPLTWIY